MVLREKFNDIICKTPNVNCEGAAYDIIDLVMASAFKAQSSGIASGNVDADEAKKKREESQNIFFRY